MKSWTDPPWVLKEGKEEEKGNGWIDFKSWLMGWNM